MLGEYIAHQRGRAAPPSCEIIVQGGATRAPLVRALVSKRSEALPRASRGNPANSGYTFFMREMDLKGERYW